MTIEFIKITIDVKSSIRDLSRRSVAIEQLTVNRGTSAAPRIADDYDDRKVGELIMTPWETIHPPARRAPRAPAHACVGTGLTTVHGVATLTGAHLNSRRVFVGRFALKDRVRERRREEAYIWTGSRRRHGHTSIVNRCFVKYYTSSQRSVARHTWLVNTYSC